MADTSPQPGDAGAMPGSLHELAERLRRARHVDAAMRASLADFLEQLGTLLPGSPVNDEHALRLQKAAGDLAKTIERDSPGGRVAEAKARLEGVAIEAETDAPVVTGIVRQFLETLANLGI